MLRILWRTRIVSVAVGITNLPIFLVNDKLGPVLLRQLFTRVDRLSLRIVERRGLLTALATNGPLLSTGNDVVILYCLSRKWEILSFELA
jgi:hypothetical protein